MHLFDALLLYKIIEHTNYLLSICVTIVNIDSCICEKSILNRIKSKISKGINAQLAAMVYSLCFYRNTVIY